MEWNGMALSLTKEIIAASATHSDKTLLIIIGWQGKERKEIAIDHQEKMVGMFGRTVFKTWIGVEDRESYKDIFPPQLRRAQRINAKQIRGIQKTRMLKQ